MTRWKRWLIKSTRTVHLYATLFGLVLILFFAVTGFMLNHWQWFALDQPHTRTVERPLPTDRLPGARVPAYRTTEDGSPSEVTGEEKFALVEALRREFGPLGEVVSFDDRDEKQIEVSFGRVGRQARAVVRRDDAHTVVAYEYRGWAAVAGELHKGNQNHPTNPDITGPVWSYVIDAACVLMVVIAVTGLILWWSLQGRGKWGAVVLLAGGAVVFAAYYWFVP